MKETSRSSETDDPLPSGTEHRFDSDEAPRRGMVPRLGDIALNKARSMEAVGRPERESGDESRDQERGSMPLPVQAVAAELGRIARRGTGAASESIA